MGKVKTRVTLYCPGNRGVTVEIMRDLLSLVIEDLGLPSVDVIKQWSPLEMQIVYDWAVREHLSASDNPVQRRPRPFLIRAI